MTFSWPWMLLLLALLPLAEWFRRRGFGLDPALQFPEIHSVADVFGAASVRRRKWHERLRTLALIVLILAAAKPQWVVHAEKLVSRGADMMLVLDISGSMAARDFEPKNRLAAAKQVLQEFIANEKHNRLGLVAFAAQPYIICPLTLDYPALAGLLEPLSIGMASDGTAIGMAIATALNRLTQSEAKSKVIVLLTDGRNNAGRIDPLTAADMAKALGVKIYAIGMGTAEGGAIVVKDPNQEEQVIRKADGTVYREPLAEGVLRDIAERTEGAYYAAVDREKLEYIYHEIRALEYSRLVSRRYQTNVDMGKWLIALGFCMVLIERFLAAGRERSMP